jgi:hypothetical protein
MRHVYHIKKEVKAEEVFSEEEKRDFVSKLIEPIVKYQRGELSTIYSEIEIVSEEMVWERIDYGGFGMISKGLARFVYK